MLPNVTSRQNVNDGIHPGAQNTPFAKYAVSMIVGVFLLIVITHIGFLNTYIKHFPQFKDVDVPNFQYMHFVPVMHIHGMLMMGWLLMLLLQPILIRANKMKWHRRVGRLSYILAPLVLVSIYLVVAHGYHTSLESDGKFIAVSFLALVVPIFFSFALLYALAIIYLNKPALHMRFMASTAFVFIAPGMDRALLYYFQLPGYDFSSVVILSIIAVVTIFDSVKTRKLSPFIIVFCLEAIHKILWVARESEFWQYIGGGISKVL